MNLAINTHAVTVETAERVRALHAGLLAEARQDIRREMAAEAVERVAGDAVDDVEFAEVVDIVMASGGLLGGAPAASSA